MTTHPQALPANATLETLAENLTWLADVCGTLRVIEQDGERVVRVTLDPDSETVLVAKCTVEPGGSPMDAIQKSLTDARGLATDHARRQALHLVRDGS